jgi:RecB family exonuclease
VADLVLSASSVAAYTECHYRWRLEYLEGWPAEMGVGAAVGQAVHSAAETYFKGILEIGPVDEENIAAIEAAALDVYRTTMLFETAGMADPEEPIDKLFVQGERVLDAFITDVASEIEPELVEWGFLITVNGILFSGHIDYTDSARRVRDLKVKKTKPSRKTIETMYGYNFARVGYALGYRQGTGREESDFIFDVMIRLKRDRPYHIPFSNGGPVTDRQIGAFAAALERTAEGIDKGDYRPTGLGVVCGYCPVRNACEYWLALEVERAATRPNS